MEFDKLIGGLHLEVKQQSKKYFCLIFLVAFSFMAPRYISQKDLFFFFLLFANFFFFFIGGDCVAGMKQNGKQRLGLVVTHLMQF